MLLKHGEELKDHAKVTNFFLGRSESAKFLSLDYT